MNITKFDPHDREALVKLGAYPAIVALPATFVQTFMADGGRHLTSIGSASAGKDARVISDVYTPALNRLNLTVQSQGGSIEQTFRARLNVGRREAKNHRTLRVKLIEAPHMEGRKERSGIVLDASGARHRLRMRKFNRNLQEQFRQQIIKIYETAGIPQNVDWKLAGGKRIKDALEFDKIVKYTWCDGDYRNTVAATRLVFQLCNDARHTLTLKQAVDSHLLPDYPELEVPYNVFHKFDTSVKLTFVGIIQKGGASNYTKNMQTANKLSRIIGETVKADELLARLAALDAPYLIVQPDMEIFCVAVVNKATMAAA